MKIKKKTSVMMIAAATAAVVGVAAVSFAAWTGSSQQTLTASASTGHVSLLGFTPDKDSNPVTYGGGAYDASGAATLTPLVPYDQTNYGTDQVNVLDVVIPAYSYSDNYSLTLNYTDTDSAGLTLYYLYGAEQAPTVDGDLDVTATGSDWKALGATNVLENVDNVEAEATVAIQHLYIVLVSDDGAQMNKDFSISLVLGDYVES